MKTEFAVLITVIILLITLALILLNYPIQKQFNISINSTSLSIMPDKLFNLTNNVSVKPNATLSSEGFLAISDKVFTNKNLGAKNSTIITFLAMEDSNSSVSNLTLKNEMRLSKYSVSSSGSYFKLLNESNYSIESTSVKMYTILDVGVFNNSEMALTQNAGIPSMPVYQFTTMFTYKNYYGSVTINAFTNSSAYANDSKSLSLILLKELINSKT
jgi:hypothetical protein